MIFKIGFYMCETVPLSPDAAPSTITITRFVDLVCNFVNVKYHSRVSNPFNA